MIPGVRGRLITASFIRDVLPSMPGFAALPAPVAARLGRWSVRLESALGPASGVRAITDVALVPLLDLLGFTCFHRADSETACAMRLGANRTSDVSAVVTRWGEPLDREWRPAVLAAIGSDARWCLCCNGRVLRLIDARRTWARDHIEFDLSQVGRDREAQAALWALLRAEALAGAAPFLDRAVGLSDRHGLEVCKALGTGVLEALATVL